MDKEYLLFRTEELINELGNCDESCTGKRRFKHAGNIIKRLTEDIKEYYETH